MTQSGPEELPTPGITAATAAEQIAVGAEVLPAELAAEQAALAIGLVPPTEARDTVRVEEPEMDGAKYARRLDEVLIQSPQTGPSSFRQRSNQDVSGNLGVYGNESIPVLRDGGRLAYTSAGMLTDRVRELDSERALKPHEDITVWVIDDHGVHAKVFLDTLRATDQATYARTRIIVINQSADSLATIQNKNVLSEHERVSYMDVVELASLRSRDQSPLAILAPDLPNRQRDVYQIFRDDHKDTGEDEIELQLGVKAASDTPIVTIDPESGLTDLAIISNFYGLGASKTPDGRNLMLKLGNRLVEPARDVVVDETPLRRHEESVHAVLHRTNDHQLYNFTPPRTGPLGHLIEQLRPHGLLLTSGYLNNGSHLSPQLLRRVEGAVTTYTAELGSLRQQANEAHVKELAGSTVLPKDGGYGYMVFDVTPSVRLRESAATQFRGESGVKAPDETDQFLRELFTLAAASDAETDNSAMYDTLVSKYPRLAGSYDLAVEAAKRLNERGHAAVAVAVAESAIKYAPHVCTTALIEAGKAYAALEQPAEAARRLKWAIEISPHAVDAHHAMMQLYQQHHDWDGYILAAGRYLRNARGLSTVQTIEIMRSIVSVAEQEKRDSAENPFPSKTVIVESIWIDQASGEPQVARELRYLPRWLMASIKAADLSANYADTVRRLLDYDDDMPKEERVRIVEWFNQKYELHCLRQDPYDLDSYAGERELWPDRTIRALWPDLPTNRTHRLVYTGESTLVDDDAASPQALLNMIALEAGQVRGGDGAEQPASIESLRPRPGHIELGLVPDPLGRRPSTLYVPLDTLNRHLLVVGETGSGKSNTCRNILEQLTYAGIPWLVIEAAKAEYGTMAGRLEGVADVTVIRPGDTDALHEIPVALNFLKPEPGFPILSHINMIKDSLLAAFQGEEPFPQAMSEALVKVYEKHGWDMVTGHSIPGGREPTIPTLENLIETAMEVVETKGYERNLGDVKGFIRMRIESLGIGSLGRFLEGPNGIDFADLQQRNVVIQLENLGDDKMAAFLTSMILAKQRQHLQMQEKQRRQARSEAGADFEESAHGLRHFTLIEEAARILTSHDNTESDAAVGRIADSFAILRALGEGVGASLQSVEGRKRKIHDVVLRNTAVKIVGRVPHGDDQDTLARTMNIDSERASQFNGLRVGQAYVYRSGDRGPVPMFATYGGGREYEIPNRTPPPIYGRQAPIRQAAELEVHEAQIAVGAATPEGAWMRTWIEFMTMAYVARKKLPDVPEPLRAHAAKMDPLQRRLQIRSAAIDAVARRSEALTTFDPLRLRASIETAAIDEIENGVGAGTLGPREFVVPELALLDEDIVVHRPFFTGLRPDPEDTAPPLRHHIAQFTEPRGRRTTFAERAEAAGRHPLSMRHPNEQIRNRNARIGYVALFGKDGARRLFSEDLALATGETTIQAQELAAMRAMGIAGGPGTVGWGLEILSLLKRVFHKQVPSNPKGSTARK